MKNRHTTDALRDYGLYAFKAFQDVAFLTLEKNDTKSLENILHALEKSLKSFVENPRVDNIEILKLHYRKATSKEVQADIQKRILRATNKVAIIDGLALAKNQVFFGVAAQALALHVNGKDNLAAVQATLEYLPKSLKELTKVFYSINEMQVSDFWGWYWLDFKADGEARVVDQHSRPNRLYVIAALNILNKMGPRQIEELRLPITDSTDFFFNENHQQGVASAIKEIVHISKKFDDILEEGALAKIENLKDLMKKALEDQNKLRDQKLIAAPLDITKVEEFRKAVVDGVKESGRLRPLFKALGAYVDRINTLAPEAVKSWGYNQIDEKGAFIADWHVSYSAWGESYGRGLALAEDHHAFNKLYDAGKEVGIVKDSDFLPTVEKLLSAANLAQPVIIITQSMRTTLEYDEIQSREFFISCYNNECPHVGLNNLPGFIGVIKFDKRIVPVFDVFIQEPNLRDKGIIADIKHFIRWDHYAPYEKEEEKQDSLDGVLIQVTDLNVDDIRRGKILDNDPQWLQKEPDKESFLRSHVVVNVYQKYQLTSLDPTKGIRLTITK